MGIIRPRPALSPARQRLIQERIKVHSKLLAKFEADGMSHREADDKAYVLVTGVVAARLDEIKKEHGL